MLLFKYAIYSSGKPQVHEDYTPFYSKDTRRHHRHNFVLTFGSFYIRIHHTPGGGLQQPVVGVPWVFWHVSMPRQFPIDWVCSFLLLHNISSNHGTLAHDSQRLTISIDTRLFHTVGIHHRGIFIMVGEAGVNIAFSLKTHLIAPCNSLTPDSPQLSPGHHIGDDEYFLNNNHDMSRRHEVTRVETDIAF